jgi:hypothetical protein
LSINQSERTNNYSPISEDPPEGDRDNRGLKIPTKLNGNNFVTWGKMLQLKLKSMKLWNAKTETPVDSDLVLFAIFESLNEDILQLVIDCDKASAA